MPFMGSIYRHPSELQEALKMRAKAYRDAADKAQHMYATEPTAYQIAMRNEAARLEAEAAQVEAKSRL